MTPHLLKLLFFNVFWLLFTINFYLYWCVWFLNFWLNSVIVVCHIVCCCCFMNFMINFLFNVLIQNYCNFYGFNCCYLLENCQSGISHHMYNMIVLILWYFATCLLNSTLKHFATKIFSNIKLF